MPLAGIAHWRTLLRYCIASASYFGAGASQLPSLLRDGRSSGSGAAVAGRSGEVEEEEKEEDGPAAAAAAAVAAEAEADEAALRDTVRAMAERSLLGAGYVEAEALGAEDVAGDYESAFSSRL